MAKLSSQLEMSAMALGLAQGVDLVYETGHACSLAELPFEVGQFYMAVCVGESRNEYAVIEFGA